MPSCKYIPFINISNLNWLMTAGGSPQVRQPDSHAVRFNQDDAPARSSRPTRTAGGNTRVSKLSFDDYHTTWCGIATSKTRPDAINPCMYYKFISNFMYHYLQTVKGDWKENNRVSVFLDDSWTFLVVVFSHKIQPGMFRPRLNS